VPARGGRGRGLIAVVALAALYWVVAVRAPSGPRSLRAFDPDRIAELEVGMWQAYYAKEKLRLFRLLVTMLREQYHLSWQTAVGVAFHWARAAATFGDATSDYERVLPDLEAGYATIRDWTHESFDVKAVARAELSWWTARRDQASGTGAEKNRVVAARMTELYALFYGVAPARVAEAARLRVDAADLRDRGAGAVVDWKGVSWILHQSYRALHDGVAE
jgi:hypothetical protein